MKTVERDVTSAVFGGLAAARGRRALHPRGVTVRGTLHLYDRGRVLAAGREVEALVRFSRGLGLPAPLPDVNGVAVKIPDAHGPGRDQDLLLASCGPGALGRHLLVPAVGFGGQVFSSVLPYRVGSATCVFGARVALAGDGVVVDLLVARLGGRWEPAGRFAGAERVDGERLAFDPWTTGDGVVPAGWANRLRRPAYAASRAARRRRGR